MDAVASMYSLLSSALNTSRADGWSIHVVVDCDAVWFCPRRMKTPIENIGSMMSR